MVDETKTSLIMKFENANGPIEAECPLFILAGDPLATQDFWVPVLNSAKVQVPGFKPTGPNQLPRHFLIKSFGFSASLASGESRKKGAGAQNQGGRPAASGKPLPPGGTAPAGGPHRHAAGGLGLGHSGGPANGDGAAGGDQFAQWRSATDNSWNQDGVFASHIDDFHFTRFVDTATNALFTACCKGTSFTSASLIKRKASRPLKGETFIDLTYLRIDFVGVKITELKWTDGDIIEENCKFTCDGMQVSYAVQDMSGKLAAAEPPVGWSNPMTQTAGRGTGSA